MSCEEKGLAVGLELEFDYTVTAQDTAEVYGSGALPVLATPRVVGLMEQAALRCLEPHLGAGDTTVGVRIAIDHVQASPVGSRVRVCARLEALQGRKYSFRVSAYAGETLLAQGEHDRFVVQADRFMAKLQ